MRIEILKNQRSHFEKACAELSVSYEIFTNERNPNWETVILPELSGKEAWHLCMAYQIGVKDEMLNAF